MRRKIDRDFFKNSSGAVAATYALALIPVIALAGFAFDYTRLVGMDSELQNAADQAALAAATQLDRSPNSMTRAINAAQGSLVSNSTVFSNDGSGSTIAITDSDTQIIFFASKADAEAGTNGFTDTSRYAEAGFVQVIVDTRQANYALTPVVGALHGSLNAAAVGGMGSALCRIPPIMVCNPDEANNGGDGDPAADFDIATRAGTGLLAVAGPSGGSDPWGPGNFGFLDLGNGADAVAEGLGWLGPGGGCTSLDGAEIIQPDEPIDTEPGLKAGAIDSINTRFDIFASGNSCKSPGECPSAYNARKDVIREARDNPDTGNACALKDNQGWYETSGTRYLPTSVAPLPVETTPVSMGHPRDICHAVSETGSCPDGRYGDGVWDRDAYFRSHYVRTTTGRNGEAAGTRWTQADWQYNLTHGTGALSTTSPTRYQVYLWELAREGQVVDGVEVLGVSPVGATGATEVNHAKPICSQQHGYSGTLKTPDRRVMTIAVVNCVAEGVSGKTPDVQIATWLDVFLVQPSHDRDRTDKSDIYFEIIRKTDLSITGQNNAALIRRDVPYLVK